MTNHFGPKFSLVTWNVMIHEMKATNDIIEPAVDLFTHLDSSNCIISGGTSSAAAEKTRNYMS